MNAFVFFFFFSSFPSFIQHLCKTKEGEYEENSVVSFPCIIHIAVTFCAVVAIKIKCGVLDGYSGVEGGLLKLRTKFYMRIFLPPFWGVCGV